MADLTVREVARTAPGSPGVYFFYSDDRQLLYIGKSVSLRRRLRSHFPDRHSVHPRPTRQQIAAASTSLLSWCVCESELEALVLEDRLIKEHLPIANKRQKKFLLQQYIGINAESARQIRIIEAVNVSNFPGWDIVGPYSDRFYADEILDIGIRYTKDLAKTRAFLSGADRWMLSAIENSMAEHSAARRFELAQKDKERLETSARFLEKQQFVNDFSTKRLTIECNCGARWEFHSGAFLHDELNHRYPPDDSRWWLLDRAQVVQAWIRAHKESLRYEFSPDLSV